MTGQDSEAVLREALRAIVAYDTPLPAGLLQQAQAALASPAAPAGGGTVDDAMVERAQAAEAAYWGDMTLQISCKRCAGRGYHHGFGEDGSDPDWCDDCSGRGVIHAGCEEDAMRAALEAALHPQPAEQAASSGDSYDPESERRLRDGIMPPHPLTGIIPASSGEAQREELSPEFTDTARAALLWVLWHHQGGSSKVGGPIRYALGMGQHDPLTDYQVREAKRWAAMTSEATPPPAGPVASLAGDADAWAIVAQVRDTFARDEAQGYHTRDRRFAIDLLTQALATRPAAGEDAK